MVQATLFIPEKGNGGWKHKDTAEVGKGKNASDHAEQQLYRKNVSGVGRAGGANNPQNVYLFVQDGAPCQTCHNFFLNEATNGRAFIFILTGTKYDIPQGVTVESFLKSTYDEETLTPAGTYKLSGPAKLDDKELPVPLYFCSGSAYLSSKPHDFPMCPPLTGHLKK